MLAHNCKRTIVILAMTFLTYLFGFIPDTNILSTLFTVLSIFISIGFSVIISFDLSSIKNDFLYKKILSNLREIRKNYIYYFSIIVISYVFYPRFISLCNENKILFYNIEIDLQQLVSDLVFSLMVFGIIYYIYNFYSLQSLREEIAEELRK